MESSLFGIFVLAILYDQIEAIVNDETTIEQLQGAKGSMSIHKIIMSQICRLPCYSGTSSHRSTLNTHSV